MLIWLAPPDPLSECEDQECYDFDEEPTSGTQGGLIHCADTLDTVGLRRELLQEHQESAAAIIRAVAAAVGWFML
jgi:hypothetical protein